MSTAICSFLYAKRIIPIIPIANQNDTTCEYIPVHDGLLVTIEVFADYLKL